ncbi:MAG: non-canonical purine NTP pyrophosphatase, partial [Streptosporangiaceae bacterium]
APVQVAPVQVAPVQVAPVRAATEQVVEGRLHGSLTRAPRGANGFGYDPIFVPAPAELDGGPSQLTTAELDPAAKDAISHRGRALRALAPVIAELLAAG